MDDVSSNTDDREMIEKTVQFYIDGAKSGKGDDMKPAFHADATIFGYIGDDLFSGPIQKLFDWNDENGPATDLETKIASIDIAGTVATVRLESDNWTGHKFTDFFTNSSYYINRRYFLYWALKFLHYSFSSLFS